MEVWWPHPPTQACPPPLTCKLYLSTAVYMSQHRNLWENSPVFPNSLSQKTTASHHVDTQDTEQPPPAKGSDDRRKEVDDSSETGATPPEEYGHGSLGCTYELCAGIVDKQTSLQQIAKEEIHEETGYDVPLESIECINSYYSSIGTGGSQQTVFYCEVTDAMLESDGGGNSHEGEMIETYHLPIAESDTFVFDTSKPKSVGLCFSLMWFDRFKKPYLSTSGM